MGGEFFFLSEAGMSSAGGGAVFLAVAGVAGQLEVVDEAGAAVSRPSRCFSTGRVTGSVLLFCPRSGFWAGFKPAPDPPAV